MASACVNSSVSVQPEGLALDCTPCGWLSPSRVSFTADFADGEPPLTTDPKELDAGDSPKDPPDFEFRLEDPVAMLPADELFSDGKLVPLQLAAAQPAATVHSEEPPEPAAVLGSEAYGPSPKAPACSSRWKELLGLKKEPNPTPECRKLVAISSRKANPKALRAFLKRCPKASSPSLDASLSLPLLADTEPEPAGVLSSAKPELEDLPRLSLDSDKTSPCYKPQTALPPRVRLTRPRPGDAEAARSGRIAALKAEGEAPPPAPVRSPAADSPRLNAAGKVVFQGLERSSSSPSSLNGGPRVRHRPGIERSYSANVRIAPVLNVPVCSLRGSRGKSVSVLGFERLFAPQRRAGPAAQDTRSGGGGKGKAVEKKAAPARDLQVKQKD